MHTENSKYERHHPHRRLSTNSETALDSPLFPECIFPFVLPTSFDGRRHISDLSRLEPTRLILPLNKKKNWVSHTTYASSLLSVLWFHVQWLVPFMSVFKRGGVYSPTRMLPVRGVEGISLCRHGFLPCSALKILFTVRCSIGLDVDEATPAREGSHRIVSPRQVVLRSNPSASLGSTVSGFFKGDGFTACCQ